MGKIRNVLAGGIVAGVLSGTLAAAPASAQQPWIGLQGNEGAGLRACVAQVKQARSESWTCIGGELTTRGANGQSQTTIVANDFQDTTASAPGKADSDVTVQADDYDSWCENGSICGRRISDYIAEVKGNGAYGDANGVIGAFDFVVRQAFNGQRPRWRNILIWDYGPQIESQEFTNNCRINVTGPDGYCGQNRSTSATSTQRTSAPTGPAPPITTRTRG